VIGSNPKFDTDEMLQEFCGTALQDDFFIYSNTNSDDSKVTFLFLYVQCTYVPLQEYTGPFRSQLVVRTFAEHFSAIQGAIKVPALGDKNSPINYPSGGLALSAAAVGLFMTAVINSNLCIL